MEAKNNRRRKLEGEQDRVLRATVIIVIVLLMIGAMIVTLRLMNPRADITEGTKRLKQLEAVDVTKVDKKIQKLEKAERDADEARANRPVNEKFANSIVLGDSISQGLNEFGIIDGSHVIATKGCAVTSPEDTGVLEDVKKAEQAKPQNLFLAYGMNDIEATRGDAKAFAVGYGKLLDEIKATIPETTVYVNGILPVKQNVIDANEWYSKIPEFNEQLEQMCKKKKVKYIDNTDLVKEEYYTEDGIHLSPDYYPGWVNRMAEAADL